MKTQASRIVLIFVLGNIFHIACLWGAFALHNMGQRAREFEFLASDLTMAQTVMRATPPDRREDLIRSFNRGFYELSLDYKKGAWVDSSQGQRVDEVLEMEEILGILQPHLYPPDHARVVIPTTESEYDAGIAIPVDPATDLIVTFDIEQPFSAPKPWVVVGYISVVFLISAALAALAIRLSTRPLRTLAGAAKALGTNLDAVELRESGPTEVREATRAFNLMQRAIKQSLDERTQLLASISHDLKTPLTRLALRADSIPVGPLRDSITSDLERMSALVIDGLEFARSLQLREPRVVVDLQALAEAIGGEADDLGWRVAVRPGPPVRLRCAPRALQRALWNLVENACVHGGSADIRVVETATAAEISIEDRGPGIPAGQFEQMFEPYVRGEAVDGRPPPPHGTGLGLAIARNIIHCHGGSVTLRSGSAGGVLAMVTLPHDPTAARELPG